ncbi:MAG: hypothetical protein IPL40_05785 [Proteobacteria bacterium]|nr:hypothetical protein [Pseudomonadota bacterium]
MILPRRVIAGETLIVTRRCAQRQFLLRPSATANGIIGYCLAVAVGLVTEHHHWPGIISQPA